ncbi:MAG: DUF814 domain-containing protein [Acidobacteria bacterium]|nr:MAG: DUF814 domain-containing protein [Acidobacteriota bacterium]
MSLIAWLAGIRHAATLARHRLDAVAPCGGTGLQLRFDGPAPGRRGVRLDTRPDGGAIVPVDRMPPRVRGGRGAWPALAALAQRELRGRRLARVGLCFAPRAVRLGFEPDAALTLVAGPPSGRLTLELAGRAISLPEAADRHAGAAVPGATAFEHDLAAVARRWRIAASARPPDDPEFLEQAARSAGLPARLLVRLAGSADRVPALLETLADLLDGPPVPLVTAIRGGRVDLLAAGDAAPPDPRCELFDDPAQAAVAWYEAACRAGTAADARRELARVVRAERRRAQRALAAVERERDAAPDPERLRRQADALLAAGGHRTAGPDALFRVPDPCSPGATLEIRAGRGGERAAERAARLYARARKEARAAPLRRARADELSRRLEVLDELAARLDRADDEAALDGIAAELRALGVAAGLGEGGAGGGPARGRRARPEPAGPARVYTSPGGFEVLVGRTARQNDELTFKVARPDDLFLHVDGTPGAHVILRAAGRREVPEQDVLFAAGLAARHSSVPSGVAVDVRVARRRHVRKPRGAPPGTVTLKTSRTVRVVAP